VDCQYSREHEDRELGSVDCQYSREHEDRELGSVDCQYSREWATNTQVTIDSDGEQS